jgi:hypothetical protein
MKVDHLVYKVILNFYLKIEIKTTINLYLIILITLKCANQFHIYFI